MYSYQRQQLTNLNFTAASPSGGHNLYTEDLPICDGPIGY